MARSTPAIVILGQGSLATARRIQQLYPDALILPCLGRTDIDIQADGPQAVTVEDSFSMVHGSNGQLQPLSKLMKSEPAILAGIAAATLGSKPVDWNWLVADYGRIATYVKTVTTTDGKKDDPLAYNDDRRADSLYAAALPAGASAWAPLNRAQAILYVGLDGNQASSRSLSGRPSPAWRSPRRPAPGGSL